MSEGKASIGSVSFEVAQEAKKEEQAPPSKISVERSGGPMIHSMPSAPLTNALQGTSVAIYGAMVPEIVKWSSVMKSTPQRLHSNTLTSGAPSTLGMVRITIIG